MILITALNRDKISYYSDMQFMNHFLRLLKLRAVNLELIFLENIPAKISDRKRAGKLAFECISKAYVSIRN